MTDVEGLYVNIGADVSALPRALGTAEQRIDQFARRADSSLAKADASFARLNAAVSQSAQLLGVYLGIDVAARVIAAADAWKLSASKIALYTASVQEAAAVQDLLFEAAQRSRSAMQPTVGLYTSLADAMLGMGKNQGEVVRVTETVAKTFKISGTEAGAASGAITQLSQALASGVLRGDEFNSVMEASPRLAKAMAEGLGVPRGALKGLAEQGALTADKVVNALLRQSTVIDSEFGKVAVTVADAWTAVGNAVQREIGRLDQAFGVTDSLSSDLLTLADNMHGAMLAGFGLLATFRAIEIARMLPAGAQALLRFVDDLKVATYARAAATAEAAAADKAAAAAELVRTQQARGLAATTASYAQAEVQRRVAVASAATATLAAAENELTAAKAKSLYATNVYTSAKAIARETEVQLAATMAREASITADQQKAAALGRLAAANTVLAGATETVAVANAGLTASAIRSDAATAALGKSVAASTVAFNVARWAGSNMLAFVGGPMGAAFLAAAGAVGVLAFHTTAAERAGDAFADAQRATQAALKDTTSDVDGLVKQYSRLSDSMRAVTLMRMEEAMAKQRDAIIAARRAVELSAATSGNSPFRIVEGNHGADNLTDVRAFEAMGLSADQVERLRLAFDGWRASAPDDARALGLLMQAVYGVGKEAGDAGASLLAFARQNAETAEGADTAGRAVETLNAHMVLAKNPTDAAAKAVLDAGQRASGAAGEFARMSGSVGALTGKLADLSARAALLSMPVGFARKVAEITGPAPEAKTPVVTGFQDRRSSDDDVAYQQHQSGVAATAVVLSRTSTAEMKDRTAEVGRQVQANRLLAGALTDTAKAEAQNRVELSKVALEYPGLGEATAKTILTTKDFGATLATLPPELQALWKQMGASSAAQLSGDFAQLVAQTSLETASTIRLAEAYGQGAAAVEAANRQIEIETRLLKLGEGARGQVTAMVNAEADARQRLDMAKWVAETDAQMAAARRLADAEAQGGEAVAEANVQNKIAEELARQRIGTGTKEAGVIEAKIRALEGENRARRAAAELRSADDDLSYARAELALMGQTEQARDRALVSLRNQQQAARLAGEIGVDAAQRWLATQEQIADTHALKAYADAVRQTADTIATDWAETLFDAMTLQDKSTSILDAIKALLRRIALEFLKTKIVLPVVTQVVGSASGLFGISAPATGAGTSGLMGQAGNAGMNWASGKALSWAGDQLGLGGVYNGALNWAGGAMGLGTSSAAVAGAADLTAVAAGDAVMAAWGGGGTTAAMQGAGAAAQTMAVGAGDAAMASGGGLTSAGSAMSGALGSAGAGAVGGYLGGLLGTATNSKAVGGLSGAALGAGSAALASYMGLGAMGGPVGLAIGAVVGGIMGMLGTQKAEYPYGAAWVRSDSSGQVFAKDAAGDNGYDPAPIAARAAGISALLSTLATAGGLSYGEQIIATDFHGKRGNRTLLGGWEGEVVSTSDDPGRIALDILRNLTGKGAVSGMDTLSGRVLSSALADNVTDIQRLGNALDLSRRVTAGATALKELDKTLRGVQVAAFEAADKAFQPMLEELRLAQEFNFDADYRSLVSGQLQQVLDDIRSPQKWTETQAAVAQVTGQLAGMRGVLAQVSPQLAATIDAVQSVALDRIYGDWRKSFDASMNEANGQDYRNQLQGVRDWWNENWADALSAGRDPTDLYEAQAKRILSGLDASQIDDVVQYFRDLDPVMSALAASMKAQIVATDAQTAAAQRAADAAAALAQRQADLQSAGGDVRQWLDARASTASASVSPEAALTAAQAQFDRDLTLARGGDVDASRRITDTADRLLSASDAMWASGPQYQAMERWVLSSLQSLPATKSYDQQILEALQKLGTGLSVEVSAVTIKAVRDEIVQTITAGVSYGTLSGRALEIAQGALAAIDQVLSVTTAYAGGLTGRQKEIIAGAMTATQQVISALVYPASGLTDRQRELYTGLLSDLTQVLSVDTAYASNLTDRQKEIVAAALPAITQLVAVDTAYAANLTDRQREIITGALTGVRQWLDIDTQYADGLTDRQREIIAGTLTGISQYVGVDTMFSPGLTDRQKEIVAGVLGVAEQLVSVTPEQAASLDARQKQFYFGALGDLTQLMAVKPQVLASLSARDQEVIAGRLSTLVQDIQLGKVDYSQIDTRLKDILTATGNVSVPVSLTASEQVQVEMSESLRSIMADIKTHLGTSASQLQAIGTMLASNGETEGYIKENTARTVERLGGFGFRETGGPVRAGSPYIVGEKRPEVFVPDADGFIVPSVAQYHAMAASSGGAPAGVPVPRLLIEAPAAVAARVDVQPVVTAVTALTRTVQGLRDDLADLGRADHEQRYGLAATAARKLDILADGIDRVARRLGGG